jgi:thiol-disulfide isomerase/thioredoxin
MMTTIVLVLAFVAVGILVYRLWKPMIRPAKQAVAPNEANLYFFYTNWCGFSQKAMPEWSKLDKHIATSSYFGKTHVNLVEVDCEADQKTCSLYGINGYPTVLLETKSGLTDFTKRVTKDNLLAFLRDTLGEEREGL